eukprot:654150-Prorocentrum_minimum.AAC.1
MAADYTTRRSPVARVVGDDDGDRHAEALRLVATAIALSQPLSQHDLRQPGGRGFVGGGDDALTSDSERLWSFLYPSRRDLSIPREESRDVAAIRRDLRRM